MKHTIDLIIADQGRILTSLENYLEHFQALNNLFRQKEISEFFDKFRVNMRLKLEMIYPLVSDKIELQKDIARSTHHNHQLYNQLLDYILLVHVEEPGLEFGNKIQAFYQEMVKLFGEDHALLSKIQQTLSENELANLDQKVLQKIH